MGENVWHRRSVWALPGLVGLLCVGIGAAQAQAQESIERASGNMRLVTLTVRGPDGKLLRDHPLTVFRIPAFGWDDHKRLEATGHQGRVTVDMPTGLLRLRVLAPGVGYGATGIIQVGPAQTVSATLPPLTPFARLSGTVAPAFRPGVIIRLQTDSDGNQEHWRRAAVDAQGRFVFRDLPAGQVGIELVWGTPAQSYYFYYQVAPGEVREGVVLAPSPPDIIFPPYVAPPATRTATLRGMVTDDQGRPVAGARVDAEFPDPQPITGGLNNTFNRREPDPLTTFTTTDGSYTFPNVTISYSAVTIPLAASALHHPPAFGVVRSAPEAPDDLRVDLVMSTQGAGLNVRVTTLNGEPAAGVTVHLQPTDGIPGIVARPPGEHADPFFTLGPGPDTNAMSHLFVPSAVTEADGTARFADLLPGLWDAEAGDAPKPSITGISLSNRSGRSRGIAVQAGRDAACTLVLSPRPVAPSVRVLSPDGQPVPVQGAALEPGSAVTDTQVFADHRVSDSGTDLPDAALTPSFNERPGLWRVTENYRDNSRSSISYSGGDIPAPYNAAGVLTALSPAVPPPGLLTLHARRRAPGTLRVQLEGVDGRPAAGSVLIPSIFNTFGYAAMVDAHGEAVFTDMPAGTYPLVGSLAGQPTPPTLAVLSSSHHGPLPTDAALAGWTCLVSQEATVALDSETRVILRAAPAGFVRGRIIPAAGTPLGHYSLTTRYVPGYGEADAAGKIDPETGEFVYGPLPPGPATLTIDCEDMVREVPLPVSTVTANVVGGRVIRLAPIAVPPLLPDAGVDSVRGTVLLHDGVTPAWGAQAILFVPSQVSPAYPTIKAQMPADALGHLTGVAPLTNEMFSLAARSVPPAPIGPNPNTPTLVVWMPGLTGAVLVPYAKGKEARIVLPAPSRITGRVTIGRRSAAGLPGTIRVLAAYQGRGRLNAFLSRDVTAQPDGAFTLDGLTPGVYRIQAARDGIWLSKTLSLTVGDTPASVSQFPMTLDIAPAGAPVVLHPPGVPGQMVRLDRPQGPLTDELWPSFLRTDGAGELRLDGLEAGRHTIRPATGGPPITFDVPQAINSRR